MADVVSPAKRSRMMAGIKSKNTKPELVVRSALHDRGLRFRLHRDDLPGKPDLYFPKFRSAVFVHGCFWHGHDCKYFKLPKTNSDFWLNKIKANQARDIRNVENLEKKGIRSTIIWECETKSSTEIFKLRIDNVARWIQTNQKSVD